MEIKGALRRSILWILLLSAQIFCSDMVSQNCSVNKNNHCYLSVEKTKLESSTDIWYYVERPKHYRNVERTSTIKTDSVLVTASMPYKVCKDSSFTISLQVKNLSRQAIYCVSDMKDFISFGGYMFTSTRALFINYTFEAYEEMDIQVKLIKIEPDSTFSYVLPMKLNEIGKFNPKDYFYSDITFGYMPSYALLKEGKVKPGLNENSIMLSVYNLYYYTVEVDIGAFRCEVEACP